MSNTNERVYVPGSSAKGRETDFGFCLNLSFKASDLGDFVKKNKNEKGYINLSVTPRKEVGPYGDTHSVSLDTWKPQGEKPAPKASAPKKVVAKQEPAQDEADEDDIPF